MNKGEREIKIIHIAMDARVDNKELESEKEYKEPKVKIARVRARSCNLSSR